jgi:uncharacterized protein YlbG (UPF0298 family)
MRLRIVIFCYLVTWVRALKKQHSISTLHVENRFLILFCPSHKLQNGIYTIFHIVIAYIRAIIAS